MNCWNVMTFNFTSCVVQRVYESKYVQVPSPSSFLMTHRHTIMSSRIKEILPGILTLAHLYLFWRTLLSTHTQCKIPKKKIIVGGETMHLCEETRPTVTPDAHFQILPSTTIIYRQREPRTTMHLFIFPLNAIFLSDTPFYGEWQLMTCGWAIY